MRLQPIRRLRERRLRRPVHQQDDAIHLIRIAERDEPRILPCDEVAKRVKADCRERFEHGIYRQVEDKRLGTAGFAFDEEAVRRLLAGPGEAGDEGVR